MRCVCVGGEHMLVLGEKEKGGNNTWENKGGFDRF